MKIEAIVEDILHCARCRPGKDLVSNIHAVKMEISGQLMKIIETYREAERQAQADAYMEAEGKQHKLSDFDGG